LLDEISHVEVIVQMKERELKAVADRRDMLSKDLEEARVE